MSTCIFCNNKELCEFYSDKYEILVNLMSVLRQTPSHNDIKTVLQTFSKETYENVSERLNNHLQTSNLHLQLSISEKIKDLELSIEKNNFKNKFTPSIKGCISEDNLFEILSEDLYTGWDITKTNTSGTKKGDIFLQNENTKILIDLKDYSSNIPTNQVDKIKRDMLLHGCNGLLVSINTNITKHKDYTFEIVGDKILAYISKGDVLTKIKSWVNLIECLEKMLNQDIPDKISLSQKDVKHIFEVCKDYDNRINDFKDFLEDNIKRSKNELIKLSSQKSEDIFMFLKSKKIE